MVNYKQKYNQSDRDTLQFAHDYRTLHGREAVQSFLGDHLVDITDVEAAFLTLTKIRIKTPTGEVIEKVCVVTENLQAVLPPTSDA